MRKTKGGGDTQHRGRRRRGDTQPEERQEEKKGEKITHGTAMGSEGAHVGCCSRSASAASQDCAVQQAEGRGGGRGRGWEGETDDVKSFELFRRPLHRM